jgi:hypothetical protein
MMRRMRDANWQHPFAAEGIDAMDFEFDEADDFSSALGTETLTASDMVLKGFNNTPRAPASIEQLI